MNLKQQLMNGKYLKSEQNWTHIVAKLLAVTVSARLLATSAG